MGIALDPAILLGASERHDRDWTRQLIDAVNGEDGRPGAVIGAGARLADVIAALHGAGLQAERSDDRPEVLVGHGPPQWLIHTDGPPSLDRYLADLATHGTIRRALLLSAPADFARHRADADGDPATIAQIDAMQGYAEWSGCRHQALAGVAGEAHPGSCGRCDNCLHPPTGLMGAEDARAAVEAVEQTGRRFGAKHIVTVLRGERTPTVEGHGHDRLAVWGTGSGVSRGQWDGVLRQLLGSGVLAVNPDGGLVTTPLSDAVRTGARTIRFARHVELPEAPMPKRRGVPASRPAATRSSGGAGAKRAPTRPTQTAARRATPARAAEDAKRALYRWRATYAAELGVPAIRILTDPDISRLIVRRPQTIEELRRIITPSRCDAHGEAILAALADL